MANAPAEILLTDIHDLPISRSLKNLLATNRLNNLKVLLDYPMEEWFAFAGFSQHLLNELINYLESNRLLPLVKD